MNRITLAIIALFSAAIVLYWQVQVKRSQQESSTIESGVRPDFVVDDLRSVEFDEKGEVHTRVTATHMEHFDSSNLTFFTNPVYLVYPDEGKTQWRLSAETGNLNKNTGKVVLETNVIIDAIAPHEPIQSLSTTVLELDLNTMIMTSDDKITIKGNGFNVQGTGLYADLNAQEVHLLSQVVGIYETN
ncbi:LPS export ABC transporter periplasmic protein LptC [Shewanella gelidii]|uniref:Lipopolysaccharide export system protein LptC n=1 Tax=Shewanella gelidii TaxID=1642821 RepID=A0A917JPZ9_9GAMM|nr:LPS export ABC transporter periplasmic protein LptC [Shewanella gelidii]MCL1097683.1 LPS export ABC transporter periplasmic protein LptC [Shewanella gelidii]GGI79587.1 lipopolysaccharide export system protein LptC [Shewanella gelidii]